MVDSGRKETNHNMMENNTDLFEKEKILLEVQNENMKLKIDIRDLKEKLKETEQDLKSKL